MTSSLSTPPPYPGAPTTTKVLGYFNSFSYPMQLHVPEINRQFMLAPREYLTLVHTERDPKTGKDVKQHIKINDPIFGAYVGANKLSVEEGEEDVPIIWLARPVLQPIPTHMFEFAGNERFKTDVDGRVLNPERVLQQQQQQTTAVPASASAITGYSMEQAKQMGIIANTTRGAMPEKEEIQEDKTLPAHARPAPLPRAVTGKQPNVPVKVPPPLAPPPKNERLFKAVTAPPAAKVAVPPTKPIGAPPQTIGVPLAPIESSATNQEAIAAQETAEDLMSDVPLLEGQAPIENEDLTKLTSNLVVSAGLKPAVAKTENIEASLPEPQLNEAPIVEQAKAVPVAAPTPPPLPAVEQVKHRRRSHAEVVAARAAGQPSTP